MTEKLEPFGAQITVDTSKALNDLSAYILTVEDFINLLRAYKLDDFSVETQRGILTALCTIQCAIDEMRQEADK